jgi:hypothetical protein
MSSVLRYVSLEHFYMYYNSLFSYIPLALITIS